MPRGPPTNPPAKARPPAAAAPFPEPFTVVWILSGDYEALNDRLKTLPDQLSYDVMVPFGPLAFMPGKLVHTNEVTVLLGDNWFAKCSAKQAQKIVDHRMKHVKHELGELTKTMKNFEARVGFAKDLETMSLVRLSRTVQKHTKNTLILPNCASIMKRFCYFRLADTADMNGEDTSSSSSEEEKDGDHAASVNGLSLKPSWTTGAPSEAPPCKETKDDDDEEEEEEVHTLPTISFSHTVEPKKVRINTGKNTTLKYSEKKEQKEHSKKKKKNGHSNGHSHPEHYKISSPADIYRLFVDVKNGEPFPRKSILKSRSRENSVCSDTSESSAADFEERRMIMRSCSHDDANTHSDTSDGITEEDSPTTAPMHPTSRFEAFSGTVIEKDPMPTTVPHLTIAPPGLPTILERKQEEVGPEAPVKKLSKFKAARLQQK
uniref:Uncharacterized protein n=1 Tax=Periophthalmus magnuspinnatus TaxID=409849 RepID=A0A3B3ZBZ7_9GOBI